MDRCEWCNKLVSPIEREDSIHVTTGAGRDGLVLCGRCLDRWQRQRRRDRW